MATYYINNDFDLANTSPSQGDVLLFRSGTRFSAAAVPSNFLSASGLSVGYFGSGDRPVITGGVERTDWTYDGANNVYSLPAYATNVMGNVTEDFVPMKHIPWNTNLTTTALQMTNGTGIGWAGSMTFDPVARIVYIRPSAGLVKDHRYIVSEAQYGIRSVTSNSDLTIDGLQIEQVAFHGIHLFNKKTVKIKDCFFRVIGGGKPGSLYLGNGIELSSGVVGAVTSDCVFHDIFDSCVTTQLYEATPTRITDHTWNNLVFERYGMAGVEVSCQTATNQLISHVNIETIRSKYQASGWSGDRNAGVIVVLTQGGTSRVTHTFATDVVGDVQRRLYLSYQTGGFNGIQNSTGTNTFGQGVRSDQGEHALTQKDIKRNVVDNLAPVSPQSSWVDVQADIRNNMKGLLF